MEPWLSEAVCFYLELFAPRSMVTNRANKSTPYRGSKMTIFVST